MKANLILAAALWAGLGAVPATAANFVFANGDAGFRLESLGAAGCPCDLVASLVPDSDVGVASELDLATPTAPTLFSPAGSGAYRLQFSLIGAPTSFLAFPGAPDASGLTSFRHLVGDFFFDVGLQFGPGVVSNWHAFSPRSAPDGASFGATFDFVSPPTSARGPALSDPFVTINVSYDGQPVSYGLAAPVPEPATWALMIGGFGLAGSALRRKALARV